ncbi:methyltransferase [Nakamurella sp. GG22]
MRWRIKVSISCFIRKRLCRERICVYGGVMSHSHHRTPNHQHPPHHRPDGGGGSGGLDLDADVFSENLAAVMDLIDVPTVRGIVDLGAGTGAGSRLLRNRYPDATLTCVDNNPEMLNVLREQGFAVVDSDLDNGFPALIASPSTKDEVATAPVDLVWASSSLHHLAHPARLLSGVRRSLAPDGDLVVVELADLPSFLRDPRDASLEQRCHATAAAEGWNYYPDWTTVLEAAGFVVSRSEVTTVAPVTSAAREYARQWFARFAQLEALSENDRDAVQHLLDRLSGDVELEPRATRTVWLATIDRDPEQL